MKVEKLFGRSGVLVGSSMRVRLNRSPSPDAPSDSAQPRLRLVGRERQAADRDDFCDERRLRDAGGPDDNATYHCSCGYVFEAHVSTSVDCPHCGSSQAW
jgi:hypothetical protein